MNKRLVKRILVISLVKAAVPSPCLSLDSTIIRAEMGADRIRMVHERLWKVSTQIYPCSRVLHVCVSPYGLYLI